jgi:gas vesicle protein
MARDDSGSVVAAFVLGAITGAAVALLLAPATGEEMRRMLGDKAREGRDKAGEAAQKGREMIDRGRDAYQRARGRGGDKEPV